MTTTRKTPIGRPWPKGVSGNPAGRSKIDRIVREAVEKMRVAGSSDDGWTLLTKRLWCISMGVAPGATPRDAAPAAKILLDRAFGQPKQEVEVSQREPINLSVLSEEERDALEHALAKALEAPDDGVVSEH